jgi:hypothetical protein
MAPQTRQEVSIRRPLRVRVTARRPARGTGDLRRAVVQRIFTYWTHTGTVGSIYERSVNADNPRGMAHCESASGPIAAMNSSGSSAVEWAAT